jgi:hypothetical protein
VEGMKVEIMVLTKLQYIETDEEFIDIIEKADISNEEKADLVTNEYYGYYERFNKWHNWNIADFILLFIYVEINLFILTFIPNIIILDELFLQVICIIFMIPLWMEINKLTKVLFRNIFVREIPK